MPGSLYNVNNVKVGVASGYIAPWNPVTKQPAPLVVDTSVLFDPTLWLAGTWLVAGATDQGWKLSVNSNTQVIDIEEQSSPADVEVTTREIKIEAALSEDTLQSMKWAYGSGNIVVTAPGTGQPGKSVLTLDDGLTYYTVALETQNTFGLARRIYVPKCVAATSVDTAFRRAAAKRMYPISFSSVCKPSEIQIVEITAPGS